MAGRRPGKGIERCVALAMACVLTACSSRPPVSPTEAERRPRSVAIVPVLAAGRVSFDQSIPSLGAALSGRGDRDERSRLVDDRFAAAAKRMGPELTEALRAAVVRRGLEAMVVENVVRPKDDPEDLDLRKVASEADVVLHVEVRELGLVENRGTWDVVTTLDVSVEIVGRRSGAVLFDTSFRYGGRDEERSTSVVPAADRDRFPTLEDALEQSKRVEESWRIAARTLSRRIVDQWAAPLR